MKKLFSLLLTVCLILAFTACNTADTPEDTSLSTSASETTETDTTGGKTNEQIGYTFTAKILQIHEKTVLVKTDDEKMLTSSDQFYVSLPETVSAEDFSVGDVIEIELAPIHRIQETYPARLPDVVAIRHISRAEYPDAVTFFAKILNDGQSLFVQGDMGAFGHYSGWAHLPNEISADDYKKGDYVAITFPGWIMESYPPQINITAIRHLTEEEIEEFPEAEEKRICLQYMEQDEMKIVGTCMEGTYSVFLEELEEIPEMNSGDYFTIVYEEILPSSVPTQLLFIKELYISDEKGNRID